MPKLNGLMPAGAVLIFGLVFWPGACMQNTAPSARQELKTAEETMNPAQHRPTRPAAIVPIDAAAPEILATATFGLG